MASPFDLTDAVQSVIAFRDAREWSQFHAPKNLASGIAIEASELLEVFLWDPIRRSDEVRADQEAMERIREELADVIIYSLTLAHDLELDLAAAIQTKIARNAERYPVDTSRGSARKAASPPEEA